MSDYNFLTLTIQYKHRGIISTASCSESERTHIDPETITSQSMHEYYIPELVKSLKKAMQLFKKESYFDIEITINIESGYNNSDRLYLLHQSYKNQEGDTIDLYDYTDRNDLQAKINTMSYPAALKTLTAAINNIINSYYQEEQSA